MSIVGRRLAKVSEVGAEVAAWYKATTLDEDKPAVRRVNKAAIDMSPMHCSACT